MKRLLAIATVTLLLSGCASIPHDGTIGLGGDVGSSITSDNLYYSPAGPSKDASPELIISGFMNAANGPQNDYEVGRQYLTSKMSSGWKPSSEVLIQSGAPTVKVSENGSAQVTINLIARVDSDGRYFEEPAGSIRVLDYKLVKENGQWRISEAPDLTVLIAPNFKVLFRSYSLYFFDNSLTYLVPEVRWFPSRVSTGTRLMNALLDGPSEWLAPAVSKVIPNGTKLNINAVTIVDGVAEVDLTSTALKLDENKRQYLKAQIATTLEQLPDVDKVEISVAQTPMSVSQFVTGMPRTSSMAPVVLQDSALTRVSAAGSQSIANASAKLREFAAMDFAMNGNQTLLAVVARGGVHRIQLGSFDDSTSVVDSRASQLAPVFDSHGYLWTLPAEINAPFMATSLTQTSTIGNSWLPDYTPIDFELSPEGSRVAVLYQKGKTRLAFVHAIIRDGTGKPTGLGAPLSVTAANGAIDLTWADMTTVGALIPSAGVVTPWFCKLGGGPVPLPSLQPAKNMVVNGSGTVYILLASSRVVQLSGNTWTPIAEGVTALHLNGN